MKTIFDSLHLKLTKTLNPYALPDGQSSQFNLLFTFFATGGIILYSTNFISSTSRGSCRTFHKDENISIKCCRYVKGTNKSKKDWFRKLSLSRQLLCVSLYIEIYWSIFFSLSWVRKCGGQREKREDFRLGGHRRRPRLKIDYFKRKSHCSLGMWQQQQRLKSISRLLPLELRCDNLRLHSGM